MGMVQRVRRGFTVDDDSLAVEVIAHAMDTIAQFSQRTPHAQILTGG